MLDGCGCVLDVCGGVGVLVCMVVCVGVCGSGEYCVWMCLGVWRVAVYVSVSMGGMCECVCGRSVSAWVCVDVSVWVWMCVSVCGSWCVCGCLWVYGCVGVGGVNVCGCVWMWVWLGVWVCGRLVCM